MKQTSQIDFWIQHIPPLPWIQDSLCRHQTNSHLKWNKKRTKLPIIINLPLFFIYCIIFIVVAEIYLLRDGYIWILWYTYNFQVQSVCIFRRATRKITNSRFLWRFRVRHYHQRPTPPLSEISYQRQHKIVYRLLSVSMPPTAPKHYA